MYKFSYGLFLNSIICWKVQCCHAWRKADVSLIQPLIWAAARFKVCQTLSHGTLLIKHSITDQKRVSHQFLLKMSCVKQHINLLCQPVPCPSPYPKKTLKFCLIALTTSLRYWCRGVLDMLFQCGAHDGKQPPVAHIPLSSLFHVWLFLQPAGKWRCKGQIQTLGWHQ